MAVLRFLVDGGSGVAYVESSEIAAVVPFSPDSDAGAQILLRGGHGLAVINSCAEVAADWQAALNGQAIQVPVAGPERLRS